MKKFLTKLLTIVLATLLLAVAGCSGCNNGQWKESDVTLKDPGNLISANGFVAETENYVYFINGMGDSTTDNTFGAPVKGALMAASKADIVAGKDANEIEKCVVVPKLFVAKDYNAGLFISGGYVYYGTPVTDKDSSGTAANTQLQFMRTKLDGTDSTEYLKTNTLSDQYRMVEKDGVVYIVVYDSENQQIISYNTASGAQTVIAKTDVETEASETLNAYTFVDADSVSDGVIVYTTTVYTEAYIESAAENANYSRPTAKYNKVYMYKAGDESAKCVLDGSSANETYEITFAKGGYIYYTATKAVSVNNPSTYLVKVADLYAGTKATLVANADYAAKESLIVSPDEVYVKSETGEVRKTTLVGDVKTAEMTVAKVDTISTLLAKNGDYIYYINADSYVARIKIANVDAEKDADLAEQIVSDSTVPTEWYMPEIVGNYLFYSDNSEIGCSYIKFVAINAEAEEKEVDDVTTYELKGHVQLCKVAESDAVPFVQGKINLIANDLENGVFVLENDKDGVPTVASVVEAKELYDALTDAQKEEVATESKELLDKYVYALELAQAFNKLNGFDKLSAEAKDALRADYENAKAKVEEITATDYDIATIRGYIENNLNWYYQEAGKYFAE